VFTFTDVVEDAGYLSPRWAIGIESIQSYQTYFPPKHA